MAANLDRMVMLDSEAQSLELYRNVTCLSIDPPASEIRSYPADADMLRARTEKASEVKLREDNDDKGWAGC